MGLRGLCLLLAVPFVLSLAACGDNKHGVFEDAGVDDARGDAPDAPPDTITCTGAGQMACGGVCVDTNTDNNNCGTCGTSCGAGSCQNGICCPTGQTNCGGTCVDLTADGSNCGACGNTCGSGTCQTDNGMTTCCPQGQTNCNGTCVDLTSDEANCGTCAMACGGSDTCCSGTCKDTQSDDANCGTCGTTCDTQSGESCTAGTPAVCCGTGESNCSGTCSALVDDAHCGSCTNACDTGLGEACTPPTSGAGSVACCTAAENNCGGTCADPMTDEANCGGCAGAGGVACGAGETCMMGLCCGPGQTNCGGVCVDLLTDASSCGQCGQSCSGEVCNGGTCAGSCDPGFDECNGGCVSFDNDPLHCGDCTTKCAADQVCNNGACASMCDAGEASCNGACVDLDAPQGDPNHCGSCSRVCAVGEECVAGQCQLDCAPGTVLCNGVCIDPQEDEANCGACFGNGGVVCGATQTCSGGLCCASGKVNVGGICCNAGEINCGGACVDPDTSAAHCGGCNAACGSPSTCEDGVCCAAGLDHCGGNACTNMQTDVDNCGACGTKCGAAETCDAGLCCDIATEENVGGLCCPIGWANCNGVCTNLDSAASCGATCATATACAANEVCDNNTCTLSCTTGTTACSGACVDTDSDANNCGACGNACAAGQTCTAGVCDACPDLTPTECEAPLNACVDPRADSSSCGDCDTICQAGEHCSTTSVRIASASQSGFTATFITSAPHFLVAGSEIVVDGVSVVGYNGAWEVVTVPTLTSFTAVLPVQNLPPATGGSTSFAESGMCCGFGTDACNGACVDVTTDVNNCGECGNACSNGAVCVDGACECGFGSITCGNRCITPTVDPLNCGACGNVCGTGTNVGKNFCVSGGCVAACPAPLTGCGTGATAECVNTDSDSDNCGACGTKCPANQGCSAGACVPKVTLLPDPPKCLGGGPPIEVPDDTGTICTGSLGATSFTFGLCSRTSLGPISRELYTDAFDSTSGPYVASCTSDQACGPQRCRLTRTLCSSQADCAAIAGNTCEYLVKCVGGTCAGGGIGVNGVDDAVTPAIDVSPVASNSANTHVGGAFWVFGSAGLAIKGNTQIKQRFYNQSKINVTKSTHVFGDAFVRGGWTSDGNPSMTIDGRLTTDPMFSSPACSNPLPGVLTLNGGCTPGAFPTLAQPCGTRADLIDVKKIVRHYANPANNDNQLIDLHQDVLDNPATSLRIDLPCGVYYFNSINAAKPITIVVHGRTAIIVGGSIRISQEMIFDVEPDASLDIFAGGVLNVSNETTLGSPAYPRLTRLYLGDSGCKGNSSTLTTGEDFTDCCSGIAMNGTCINGGGNLAQAISLSQGGHFNGLLWAGYGTFTHSNPLEMYGSVFANYFDASGVTTVHYDNGAVQLGGECEPPTSCGSCKDCNNQACVNGQCGSCSSDSQCCPPLVCKSGTCVLE